MVAPGPGCLKLKRMAATLAGVLLLSAMTASGAAAVGGPVILGGDDLTDHGGTNSAGTSQQGWLYMENAVGNIKSQVGRANDNSIAAFGSADVALTHPNNPDDPGESNAGKAIKNAAEKNGMTVTYFEGETAMNNGMASIANGSYQPAIIWVAGTEADNDLEGCSGQGAEGQALIDNAGVINNFVNGGGGLFSHGICYQWLSALLPGLTTVNSGNEDDLFRTPAGQAAFPSVTDAYFNAGPWHSRFEGDLGGLDVLVRSNEINDQAQQDAAVVIGGGQVSLTEKPTDLSVTKADSADPSPANRDLTYIVLVENLGSNPATGVTLVDDLPAGLTARSVTASQGSCSGTTSVTCSLGNLAPAASATVRIVVRPGSAGTITNRARVSGGQPDSNAANNSDTETTTITAAAVSRARRDRAAPRATAAGVSRSSCVRRAFSARFRIRDASRLRRVTVLLRRAPTFTG